MTLMNVLLIETFKSTKLNFQKLHFNWHIFCKQILEWFASQQKFSLPIKEQSKEELNRCLQVFLCLCMAKNRSECEGARTQKPTQCDMFVNYPRVSWPVFIIVYKNMNLSCFLSFERLVDLY